MVRYEHDLRPYFTGNEGTDGALCGEFSLPVVRSGERQGDTFPRRIAIEVVDGQHRLSDGHLVTRIEVDGLPNGMALNPAQTTLYVAQDNADQVAVIDTSTNLVIGKLDIARVCRRCCVRRTARPRRP